MASAYGLPIARLYQGVVRVLTRLRDDPREVLQLVPCIDRVRHGYGRPPRLLCWSREMLSGYRWRRVCCPLPSLT